MFGGGGASKAKKVPLASHHSRLHPLPFTTRRSACITHDSTTPSPATPPTSPPTSPPTTHPPPTTAHHPPSTAHRTRSSRRWRRRRSSRRCALAHAAHAAHASQTDSPEHRRPKAARHAHPPTLRPRPHTRTHASPTPAHAAQVVKKVAPKKVVKKVVKKAAPKKVVRKAGVARAGGKTNVGASAQSFTSKIVSKENWLFQVCIHMHTPMSCACACCMHIHAHARARARARPCCTCAWCMCMMARAGAHAHAPHVNLHMYVSVHTRDAAATHPPMPAAPPPLRLERWNGTLSPSHHPQASYHPQGPPRHLEPLSSLHTTGADPNPARGGRPLVSWATWARATRSTTSCRGMSRHE